MSTKPLGDLKDIMISIIIPTKDTDSQRYKKCAEFVSNGITNIPFQIVPIVSSGEEFRFSKSVNVGLRDCNDSEYFLILNDDCYLDHGTVESMIKSFESTPNSGVVGAKIRCPDGRIDHLGGELTLTTISGMRNALRMRMYSWVIKMPIVHILRRVIEGPKKTVEAIHIGNTNDKRDVDFVTGACFLISKKTIEEVGYFDEDFEFGCEDVDYCLRTILSGLDVFVDTGATAVHEVGASGYDNGKLKRSRRLFRTKYNTDEIRRIRSQRHKQTT